MLKKAAVVLRPDIKKQKVEEEWPPQPSNQTLESARIPESISQWLQLLITGRSGESNPSKCTKFQKVSIVQDIIVMVQST